MSQPRTSKPLDERALTHLEQKIRSLSRIRRAQKNEPAHAPALPEEVGLQLTNRCNLRCEHCFQWNESGFHRLLPKEKQRDELDIELIEKILEATRPAASKLYLWGGEPLVYRHWDRLSELLQRDPRWTVLCTNGVGIEQRMESLLPISENLVSLISLDGFESTNDAVRGKGTFHRIMSGVNLLLDLKRAGTYRGEVSISAVISGTLVPDLTRFVEFFDGLAVNTLYLVFPWYIPTATAQRMDAYYDEHFSWMRDEGGPIPSWYSYQFHVDPSLIDDLRRQVQAIASRRWRIRVRFQPALEPDEVEGFILGSEKPAQGRTRCFSVASRMNVLPDGRMTMCKLFPEFSVGTLENDVESIRGLWGGDHAARARATFACGLMPICSKCVQLYLHGV